MEAKQKACSAYIKLLERVEDEMSPELLSLARDSFNEGWLQCERAFAIEFKGWEWSKK